MMRDSLASWLRRLANRISAPPAVAGARAGFQNVINYSGDLDEAMRYLQRRQRTEARQHHMGRP